MDPELACIVCNWARDLWWGIGLGGFGAAAAAGAAAGSSYEDRYSDEVGDQTQGTPATSVEDRRAAHDAARSWESRFSRWVFRTQEDLATTIWGDPRGAVGPPGQRIIGTVPAGTKDTVGLGPGAD